MMSIYKLIGGITQKVLGEEFLPLNIKNLSGGCTSQVYKVETDNCAYVVKLLPHSHRDMYEKEQEGLNALRNAQSLKIPTVYATGVYERHAYILMEYFPQAPATKAFWENLGTGLAQLHNSNTSDYFGWHNDNYIGSLPQTNAPTANGIDFFVENRLANQVRQALDAGRISFNDVKNFDSLYKKLNHILPNNPPCLLHGDLWSGNLLPTLQNQAALIDPAVYYGWREAELAFTYLFGGFDNVFYTSYSSVFPIKNNFNEIMDVYNLYPLLVHVNLFGGGYWQQAKAILKKYL